MNETYWVVKGPRGYLWPRTVSEKRVYAIQSFLGSYTTNPNLNCGQASIWNLFYLFGARCIKVKLVPVEE